MQSYNHIQYEYYIVDDIDEVGVLNLNSIWWFTTTIVDHLSQLCFFKYVNPHGEVDDIWFALSLDRLSQPCHPYTHLFIFPIGHLLYV